MYSKRSILAASAVVIVSNSLEVAQAQDSTVEQAPQAGGLEEIVVTAQRRSENAQNVPIAISALSADALESGGVTDTRSLATAVPSLATTESGSGIKLFIRGIGSALGNSNAEGSVALYVDGVYMPAQFGNFFEFSDIDHIEVLKGPQGTLFGRNSTGGVIQIVTKDPTQDLSGELSLGAANYDTQSLNGNISIPISSDLGASLAVLYKDQHDGWGRDLATNTRLFGDDELGLRGKIVYKPTADTTIKLQADYYKSRSGDGNPQNPPGSLTLDGDSYPGNFNTWSAISQIITDKSDGASLYVDQNLGFASLSSISAYHYVDSDWPFTYTLSRTPFVDADYNQVGRMYSEELHLSSPSDSKVKWLAGAMYYNYRAGQEPLEEYGTLFGSEVLSYYSTTWARSEALFAQATYPVLEHTNITLGGRESWDQFDSLNYALVNGSTALGTTDFGPATRPSLSYSKPSWRIAVDQQIASDLLAYASVNRGIKSGNINQLAPPAQDTPFQPEQVTAYEIGLKSELLDRHVRLNLAAYYNDFKNLQFQDNVSGVGYIFNAPAATTYGAEFDLQAKVTDRLNVVANGAFLHSEFGNFPGAPNSLRLPDGLDSTGSPTFNAQGNQLPVAPSFAGNVGYSYDIPIDFGTLELYSNLNYSARYSTEIDNYRKIGPITLLSSGLTWTDNTDHYSVKLWGKNLTNKYYYAGFQSIVSFTDFGTPAPPRTYGLTLTYRFR